MSEPKAAVSAAAAAMAAAKAAASATSAASNGKVAVTETRRFAGKNIEVRTPCTYAESTFVDASHAPGSLIC